MTRQAPYAAQLASLAFQTNSDGQHESVMLSQVKVPLNSIPVDIEAFRESVREVITINSIMEVSATHSCLME